MIQLELPVRWNESDRESEKLEELTDGKVKSKEPKYSYGRLSINSEDIGPYYEIDDRHTMVNDKLGKVYCIVVPFHDFKKIMTETTGVAVLSIQTTEGTPPSRRRDNPNLGNGDIDDILK